MNEDEVYNICMTLFDKNLEKFKAGHAALRSTPVEQYAEGILPLHPGAERCYQEMGITE